MTDATGKTKRILNEVAGYVEPRHMLAIMGPSGCGKSTLLDALAGRLPKSTALEGAVRLNGHVTKISYGKAAYVTQEDVLLGALTVRETLLSSAMLRLPRTMNRSEKVTIGTNPCTCGARFVVQVAIVDNVLKELGLSAAANTLVGNYIVRGVSGGQRRRVSIGCELVTSPALIFLDEPTSGLDAAAAYHMYAVCLIIAQQWAAIYYCRHHACGRRLHSILTLLLLLLMLMLLLSTLLLLFSTISTLLLLFSTTAPFILTSLSQSNTTPTTACVSCSVWLRAAARWCQSSTSPPLRCLTSLTSYAC